ncbi:hypothetical protein IC582_024489 [Cucumis melo]
MDKSWMQKNRTSSEYAYEVEMFIKNGLKHSNTSNVMACPCLKCVNAKTLDVNTIRDHLFFNGIDHSYQEWIFHGESLPIKRNNESVFSSVKEEIDEDDVDDTIGMFEAKIMHDVSYRSTLWKEAWKGRNNDYFDDATRDCASRIGFKEHGGRVRGVGGFVFQSQYFNTVKGKEKMITPQVKICHKKEDDSRCKSDKRRTNHSRSSIGSINIDLDVHEDTPSNKGLEDQLFLTMLLVFVKGTPCQLSIGSINNIVAVAMIVEDNIGCPNVKVLVDVVTGGNLTIPNPVKGKIETLNQTLGNIIEWPRRLVSTINDKQEHSTRKDVVYSSNYTDVNRIIKLLNRHVVNKMKDVDMIRIPMNELIFGSDKFVYLAREDLLN